ncbi:MAG: metallophosphoesterase [Bacilli bacterium]|nr:metallophosphoesterase [Bacilli bacterium]
MKRNIDDFTEKEKYLVSTLFHQQYSVSEISEITKLSFYEVHYLLRKIEESFCAEKSVSSFHVSDSKVLILSDTHLGSKYENLSYLQEAYQYAQRQDIHVAIHAGDLIQSTISNVKVKYEDEFRQLEHVVNDYPFIEGMKNYILLGNHDYNTLKKGEEYFHILKEREDFVFLGFKRAYGTWQDQLISICHPVKKYALPISSVENFLNLKGHSHKLSYHRDKSIQVPTLSDDFIKIKNAKAGFLIGTLDHKKLEIDSFYFQDSLHEEGPVLVKRI